VCNERLFRNGSFRELKIAKESNDLADLAKVLPESYQKSNEFSVNRKCGQNVATDDRRTFTDKDKVRRVQTLGNNNKDAHSRPQSPRSFSPAAGIESSGIGQRAKSSRSLLQLLISSIIATRINFGLRYFHVKRYRL